MNQNVDTGTYFKQWSIYRRTMQPRYVYVYGYKTIGAPHKSFRARRSFHPSACNVHFNFYVTLKLLTVTFTSLSLRPSRRANRWNFADNASFTIIRAHIMNEIVFLRALRNSICIAVKKKKKTTTKLPSEEKLIRTVTLNLRLTIRCILFDSLRLHNVKTGRKNLVVFRLLILIYTHN